MKNRTYRLLILIFCIAALTLSGCGVKDPQTTTTEETTTATAATVPETTVPETTAPQPPKLALPDDFPMDLVHSSGVGAWSCVLSLEKDGTFTGSYFDTDMGVREEAYPKGTAYLCNFSGRFEIVEQPDANSYRLKLTQLSTEKQPEEEWIENGVRYISTPAVGIDGGEDFLLYAPETPVDELGEDFLSWWPGRYHQRMPDVLSCWGLCNTKDFSGFFSSPVPMEDGSSENPGIRLEDYDGMCCYNGRQIQYQLHYEDGKLALDAWVLRGSDGEAHKAQIYDPHRYELDLTTARWKDNTLVIYDAPHPYMPDYSDSFVKLELTFLENSVRMEIEPNMKYLAGGPKNNPQPGIYELKPDQQG